MYYSSGMLADCCQPLPMYGNGSGIPATWWPWQLPLHTTMPQIVIHLRDETLRGQAVRRNMILPNILTKSHGHPGNWHAASPPPSSHWRLCTCHPNAVLLHRKQLLMKIRPLNKRKQIELHVCSKGHPWKSTDLESVPVSSLPILCLN